jgi:hypothetical protein
MMNWNSLRPALYHRLYFLLPLVSNRLVRSLWRALVWGFWLVYFGFVVLVLVLRYSILPNIENYRADIERVTSEGLGQSVSIGRIEASWEGINPDLTLRKAGRHSPFPASRPFFPGGRCRVRSSSCDCCASTNPH